MAKHGLASNEARASGRVWRRGLALLLVDDHELMRSGLAMLLEECLGHRVIETGSGEEAISLMQSKSVDLVLLDVRMPEQDGLWTLEQMRARRPDLPILMLSAYADEASIAESLERGAAGYLLKEAAVAQVAEAIETAIGRHGVYLHPVAAERMVGRRRVGGRQELTERELDVLRLLVDGATNEEIARRLSVTQKTVKTHLSGVFRKLGVSNRTQAATKAILEGAFDGTDQ